MCTRQGQGDSPVEEPRLTGALRGNPRAKRSALVVAETAVAAAMKARTVVNFIVISLEGRQGMEGE